MAGAYARLALAPGAVVSGLEFTGERFIPGTRGEIWVEHWHRYNFAARWARGRRVLDVACGEGYGTALLARHAAQVTGVDLSTQAIDHARAAYATLANARFIAASCTAIPVEAASFDVVVSFETLEHIDLQAAFLDEVARVLAPGGVLVLSCPNKLEYSDKRGFANEFHVRELYREELAALVGARFAQIAWYGQKPSFFSVIAPEGAGASAGELVEVTEAAPREAGTAIAHPLYFILLASRDADAVQALPPAISVLSDRDEWVHRDYEKVMRDLGGAARERDYAQALVAERDRVLDFMQRDVAEWRRLKEMGDADLERARAEHAAAMERLEAVREAQVRERDAIIAAKDREVTRRGGLRYWLLLPLYRFGILKHPPV